MICPRCNGTGRVPVEEPPSLAALKARLESPAPWPGDWAFIGPAPPPRATAGEQPANNSQQVTLDPRKPAAHSITSGPHDDVYALPPETLKRSSYALPDTAAPAAVRAAIRDFVGPDDYDRFLGKPDFRHLFEDPACRQKLIREYNHLRKNKIRTTPGRALWYLLKPVHQNYVQRQRRVA